MTKQTSAASKADQAVRELVGKTLAPAAAIGRAAFYRPSRTLARKIVGNESRLFLEVLGERYLVEDISLNGMLVSIPAGLNWAVGDVFEGNLHVNNIAALLTQVEVARIDRLARGARVGLRSATPIPISELQALSIKENFVTRLARVRSEGDASHLPSDYTAVMREMRDFIQYLHVAANADFAGVSESEEIAEACYASCGEDFAELVTRASQAASTFMDERETTRRAKRYTETTVSSLMTGVPIVERTRRKPFGYAGDFEVMEMYHRDAFEGTTVADKVLHRMLIQNPLAKGVLTRTEFVVDHLLENWRSQGKPESYAVTNIGCGPSREVGFLTRRDSDVPEIRWTLVDQQEEALECAYRNSRHAMHEHSIAGSLRCWNVDFSRLASSPKLLNIEGQDMIFASGLFDYLKPSRAQALVAFLYSKLKVGGTLAVGNASGPNTYFWPPEFLSDWRILYRSRKDVEAFGDMLPEGAEANVRKEPIGAYHFLTVTRRR